MNEIRPLLHSSYNPEREADRYVASLEVSTTPAIILLTEPGESWLASPLRRRFPKARILVIRYTAEEFCETDHLWDRVWRPGGHLHLQQFLENEILEDDLASLFCMSWKPSDTFWPVQSSESWTAIRHGIQTHSTVLITRGHFGWRWLKNIFKNAAGLQQIVPLPDTSLPVFLAVAGPSLSSHLPFPEDRFYVCAVSSALESLRFHHIGIDLCISTDGGWWAEKHLEKILPSVPLAFPLEATVPSCILARQPVLPLSYSSSLEVALFSIIGCVPKHVFRNGTVAGTAALLALDITRSGVYAAGLDLKGDGGWCHARPYRFDSIPLSSQNRYETLTTHLFEREHAAQPVHDVYARWFSNRNMEFKRRFFRLTPNGRKISGLQDSQIDHDFYTSSHKKLPEPHVFLDTAVENRIQMLKEFLLMQKDRIQMKPNTNIVEECLVGQTSLSDLVQLADYAGYLRVRKASRCSTKDEVREQWGTHAQLVHRRLDRLISLIYG